MPTAGKLIACLAFAAVGYVVGTQAIVILKEMARIAYFAPLGACVGGAVGWMIVGPDMQQGLRRGMTSGAKGAIFFTVIFLGIVGMVTMLRLTVRGRYRGSPMEALTDVIAQAIDIGSQLATVELLGTLLIGSMIAGWCGAYAGGRWR
jgi:hypothetical protein